jgi:hypothetical protein
MPFSQTAPLELRLRSSQRFVAVVLATFNTRETIRVGKNFINVLCVVRPVRRNIEGSTGSELVGDEVDKIGLHDTPFVVPFLRPRVREIEIYTRQGRGLYLVP